MFYRCFHMESPRYYTYFFLRVLKYLIHALCTTVWLRIVLNTRQNIFHAASRCLMDLYVPFVFLGTSWTFRCLLDLYVPLVFLGTSWTFRCLLDLYVPLVFLVTSLTFRCLLDLQVTIQPLGKSCISTYLFDF